MSNGQYTFSHGFQEKILAMVLRDPNFYTIYKDTVLPKYFESPVHVDLARIITDYYENYEKQPTKAVLTEEIKALTQSSRVKDEMRDQYIDAVNNMISVDLSDEEYLRDSAIKFGRKQAVTKAIMDSVDDIERGNDFSMILSRMQDALMVGENIGDVGTFYFDKDVVQERMKSYLTKESEKIPTGTKFLDRAMSGGLGRGELGIIIAPPGTGKTLTLVNFGAACKLEERNVVHFSLEMSEERIAHRYDGHYMNQDIDYLKNPDNHATITRGLGTLEDARQGTLVIKEYPTRTASVSTLKSFLTSIKMSRGFKPDLIIIDYPDLMKPSRAYDERRHELEILYEELRGLAQELDCAIWGASQTNRGALAKETVTIADLAESFGKAAVADFMIALSQTKEEKANGQLRYYVAKSRNGQSDMTLHYGVNYAHMRISSDEERQKAYELHGEEPEDEKPKRGRESYEDRAKREARTNEKEVTQNILGNLNKDE